MCFKKLLERAQDCYSNDRKTFAAIASITLVGILLRLLFINATDITGDEVFFTTYAYKIASLLWSAPLVAIALAAIIVVLLYLVVVKRNLWASLAIAAIMLFAKFGLGIPYLTKAPAPLYILTTASTILLTGLSPNVAGELVSSLSMVGLAFVGLYFGSKWNKHIGLLAFSLLMLSPFSVFMSSTSFLSPLGWFLAFFALTLFFEGQKDSRLLPLSGVLAAAAFATRFTTLIILPVFIAIAFLNRERLLGKENRKNIAIFFVIVFSTALFFTPLILNQFESARGWEERGGEERWDLNEAHMSAFIAESLESPLLLNQESPFMLKIMNLFYSPLFLALLAAAIALAFYTVWRKRDVRLASMLFIGIAVFAFFYSVISLKRVNRALGYEFPFIMLVSYAIFSGKRFFKARQAVAILLIAVFLLTSIQVVSVHNFRGISQLVEGLPEDSIVYASEAFFTVSYYKGIYLYDLSIRKPFFDKIFKPDPETEAIFEERKKTVVGSLEDLRKANYALVREQFLEQPGYEQLQDFKRCSTIKNGKYSMFVFFARDRCP